MPPQRDLPALRELFLQRAPATAPGTIDDDTWRDLDLDRVFASLDGCASLAGALTLYGWLRAPVLHAGDLPKLRARMLAAASLPSQPGKWRALRAVLAEVSRMPEALARALWADQPLPTAGRWPSLLAALSLCAPLAFLASTGAGILAVLAAFAINTIFHFRLDARIQSASASLHVVNQVLAAGAALARSEIAGLEARIARAGELGKLLKPLARALFEIPSLPGFDDLSEYPRIVFLTRERRLNRASALIDQHRAELRELFDLLGELDASNAVTRYRERRATCEPVFDELTSLELAGVRHPSLEDAVPNDFSLGGGMVITGSNMSGKSTFLRAVALNAITAQSLGFACAVTYRGPFVRVATALRASDELSEGKSYCYAEALRMKALLDAIPAAPRALYLLDEPFRGTNSAERIAAAYAVIREMLRGGALVIAATHDFELARMLESECQCAHFADEVSDTGLQFDYRLKPGFAGPRNAVRLLAMLGYPQSVLDDAARALDQTAAKIIEAERTERERTRLTRFPT